MDLLLPPLPCGVGSPNTTVRGIAKVVPRVVGLAEPLRGAIRNCLLLGAKPSLVVAILRLLPLFEDGKAHGLVESILCQLRMKLHIRLLVQVLCGRVLCLHHNKSNVLQVKLVLHVIGGDHPVLLRTRTL